MSGELEDGESFDGAATQASGETMETSGQEFSGTVALREGASCGILLLGIGPIFFDLSQIVLDVNAVPGAGNHLGNLRRRYWAA